MREWRWIAAFGLLTILPATAAGQFEGIPSHIDLPPATEGELDADGKLREFNDRLMQARGRFLAQDMLKDPKLREQIERLQKMQPEWKNKDPQAFLNDPKFRDWMRGMIDQHRELFLQQPNITPQGLDAVEKWLEKPGMGGASSSSQGGMGADGRDPAALPAASAKPPDSGPDTQQGEGSLVRGPAPRPQPSGTGAEGKGSEFRQRMAKQFYNWAQRMQERHPSLLRSEAVRDIMRDMERVSMQAPDADGALSKFLSTWQGSLPTRETFADLQKHLPEFDFGLADKLAEIDWPSINWPGSPNSDPGFPDMSFSAPSVDGDLSGVGTLLGWMCLPAIIGFLGWKLWHVRARSALGRVNGKWRIGPWPVHPSQVRSREELIAAFEHLALLQLGPSARNRNHRDIAAGIGDVKDKSRQNRQGPAAELATLYEKARYAPEADALDAESLGAARKNLCLLSGAPTA